MIRSYLTLALRMMIGQRGFVFINVLGLTLGIACSLMLFLYIQDELIYDRFHPDAANTFRVTMASKLQGTASNSAETGAPLGKALMACADVATTLRMANWPTFPMRYQDRAFTEPYLLLADSNFFSFFRYELIAGDPNQVLRGKDKLVLTETAARRYFDYQGPGDQSPLGKKLTLAQGYEATVAGIAKDPPHNGHFHFTVLLSLSSWTELEQARWLNGLVLTYFKLRPEGSLQNVHAFLDRLTASEINHELEQVYKTTLSQLRQQGNYLSLGTQPLTSIHLHSHLADEIEPNSYAQYVYLFGAIAIFITLLACINFMNLSTARSTARAKEVGVRKTVGALQSRLVVQFLLESFLYVLLSVLLALGLVRMMLLPFNLLTEKAIGFSVFLSPAFIASLVAFVLLVSLLAGSYPALYLARFSPIEVLKGKVRMGRRKYGIRNALVVFQFFISITLMIATFVVYRQLQFIQTRHTGFNKENVVNLLHAANLKDRAAAFKEALLQHPEISSASFANRLPPHIDWQSVFRVKGQDKDHLLYVYEMDDDHPATMGYQLAAGRFFSDTLAHDTAAVILNETATRALGISRDTLEKQALISNYESQQAVERPIVGIVKDFNFRTLKEPIKPLALVRGRQPNWELAVRFVPGSAERGLDIVKMVWQQYAPGAPFEYQYVDRNFKAQFDREQRVGYLFLLFTVLAIVIACLGVFGLATYMADQRTKEIGIRKVLGASSLDVVLLLTLDFAKLILIAFAAAVPVAWWALSTWLDQYAYHISLPVLAFLMAALVALLLALVSASHRALRAARSNPVESLRTE
jgi:putative ABC transport system permease protein